MEEPYYYLRESTLDYRSNSYYDRTTVPPHYELFSEIMDEMGQLGFFVERDKEVDKVIRRNYYWGRYYQLEFKANRYPNGFEITFYQNINYENSHGGYYDSHKLEKMPYMQLLISKQITDKLGTFLENHGVARKASPIYKTSEEKIKSYYIKNSNYQKTDMNFKLSDLDGLTSAPYNSTDKDGKIIYNGQIKYFRDYNGYICRGVVYHNINNMWWAIINKHTFLNICSFNMFDTLEPDYKHREARVRAPKEYLDKKKNIKNSTTKELIHELRRRGKKIRVDI